MAEYRRGTGPDALPQGAAKALNDAQPNMSELMLENTDIPVEFAQGEMVDDPDDNAPSDDLQILTQPHNPKYQRSVLARARPNRIPQYVVRHLPELRAAATAPDAPATLLALYNATIRELDAERRKV